MNDLITKEQASESDMRAISQMFARAANAVVDASELGKTVKVLQEEVQKLVGDTQRLREHISWLEQENVTLRGQRDEAQNALSDARREFDASIVNRKELERALQESTALGDNARGEAKLWQEEATKLEAERNDLIKDRNNLSEMLHRVWQGIKDHFKPEIEVIMTGGGGGISEGTANTTYHDAPIAGQYAPAGGQRDTLDQHGNAPYPEHNA